jgi:hypothetical protein
MDLSGFPFTIKIQPKGLVLGGGISNSEGCVDRPFFESYTKKLASTFQREF